MKESVLPWGMTHMPMNSSAPFETKAPPPCGVRMVTAI